MKQHKLQNNNDQNLDFAHETHVIYIPICMGKRSDRFEICQNIVDQSNSFPVHSDASFPIRLNVQKLI